MKPETDKEQQIKTLKNAQEKVSDEKAKKAIEEKIKGLQKPFNK